MSPTAPLKNSSNGSIRVRVNDDVRTVLDSTSLADLLVPLGGTERKGTAAAVNGTVVPRKDWSAHRLAEGDQVLVIRATQGG